MKWVLRQTTLALLVTASFAWWLTREAHSIVYAVHAAACVLSWSFVVASVRMAVKARRRRLPEPAIPPCPECGGEAVGGFNIGSGGDVQMMYQCPSGHRWEA